MEEYYCRTVFIPYSLIQSLDSRFEEQNSPYFNSFCLHTKGMKQLSRSQFKKSVNLINEVYPISKLVQEALTWYHVQKHTSQSETQCMTDLIEETTLFTDVGKAIIFCYSYPALNILHYVEWRPAQIHRVMQDCQAYACWASIVRKWTTSTSLFSLQSYWQVWERPSTTSVFFSNNR